MIQSLVVQMISFLKCQKTSIPLDSVAGGANGQFSKISKNSIRRDSVAGSANGQFSEISSNQYTL